MTQHTRTLKDKTSTKQNKNAKTHISESTQKYTEGSEPSQEEMHAMIAKEAYLIAEQRGFEGDNQLEDWMQAETTIASRFINKH